jgi:hypothetical protein
MARSAQREERGARRAEVRERELRVRREHRVIPVIEFFEQLTSYSSISLLDLSLKDLADKEGVGDEDRGVFELQRELLGNFGRVPSRLLDSFVAALTVAPSEQMYSMINECMGAAMDDEQAAEARRQIARAYELLDAYVVGN